MKDFDINIYHCREEEVALRSVCIIEAGFRLHILNFDYSFLLKQESKHMFSLPINFQPAIFNLEPKSSCMQAVWAESQKC